MSEGFEGTRSFSLFPGDATGQWPGSQGSKEGALYHLVPLTFCPRVFIHFRFAYYLSFNNIKG